MSSADYVVETAKQYSPLKAAWWVALVQGLVSLGVGILLIVNGARATVVVAQFLALYLLIHGLFEMASMSNRVRNSFAMQVVYYRGALGALFGGVLLSLLFLDWLTASAGFFWLAVGLLVYGVGGLYLAFARGSGNRRILSTVGAALFILIGTLGVTSRFYGESLAASVIAWTLTLLGVALVIVAIVRRTTVATE